MLVFSEIFRDMSQDDMIKVSRQSGYILGYLIFDGKKWDCDYTDNLYVLRHERNQIAYKLDELNANKSDEVVK